MIKDITIGQYFPGKSVLHRMDARVKILLTAVFIVMLFMAKSIQALSVGIVFTVVTFIISRIPLKMMGKSLKPIIPIVVFTAVLNLFFIRTGDVLWKWKIIKLTSDGVDTSVFMVIRIICLICGSSLLTYTTSPIELTDAIEKLLGPLKKIKVPVHELAMMMTIALRFIPTLIEETDKIINAQKARGADMETGGLIQKTKALIPILIPLFVASFRHAEELALAMECRCYHGGEGRTRMKQLKLSLLDLWGSLYCIVFLAGVIAVNIITK
ncbi:MAG: energy-coupling factor transporter transmembrane protein EcfT [Ruminococcus sp.]|uniref:energy-coupling factor transporter transmembrane component T family protein n=1 Tax=Ruminococcus sp. TaxID=41978 RepID=UPI0025D6B589|nr:energy-coupling factor transporter transmembrane component T [Ruminococcus sp.]MBO4867012.1 energy-coupling factor transporter transmembrane protein EcfT [Ruminococcus sp.]